VSPRGVAIQGVREQLFQAAYRVLVRDGPSGLSGRAVTREAGVATGLLYSHFADLDDFLAAFVTDRARQAAERVAGLTERAGQGTVAGNLAEAALALGPNLPAMASLVTSRPTLAQRLHEAGAIGAPGFREIEGGFAAYLRAERERGRVAAEVDVEALAVAVFGAAHHALLTGREDLVDRVVAALAAGLEAGPTAVGPLSSRAAGRPRPAPSGLPRRPGGSTGPR
jgi:AcrR family transcriptional regulator